MTVDELIETLQNLKDTGCSGDMKVIDKYYSSLDWVEINRFYFEGVEQQVIRIF